MADESAWAPLDTTLLVETPEHVAFRYQLAGPARRSAAYLLDLAVRGIILIVLFSALLLASALKLHDPEETLDALAGLEQGALLLVLFALEWGYYAAFEALFGASPGKRALRLRVIHVSGRAVAPGEALLRNLLRAADLLPFFYGVGLMTMLLDARFRRLGDLAAGTVVVFEPRTVLAEPRGAAEVPPELEGVPKRPALDAEERAALALFARRRGSLSVARAEELAELIAPRLRARFGLPEAPAVALLELLARRSA
jgi:uncharacterized RDD family membrane protein YckC